MTLLNDFYTTQHLESSAYNIRATIQLNPEHEIFKGHFPNNPVTPGVCMLQIIKELIQTAYQQPVFLKECSNVKFMALINPFVNARLGIHIELKKEDESEWKVKASAMMNEQTALKISAKFKPL